MKSIALILSVVITLLAMNEIVVPIPGKRDHSNLLDTEPHNRIASQKGQSGHKRHIVLTGPRSGYFPE